MVFLKEGSNTFQMHPRLFQSCDWGNFGDFLNVASFRCRTRGTHLAPHHIIDTYFVKHVIHWVKGNEISFRMVPHMY